jgi:DNA-binding transcriptional MerR regulator
MESLTVGELARLSGVTVRTLHHYDEIGLLRPSRRSHVGYRLYAGNDVDRLRAILSYRELGLGLDEIAEAVDTPNIAGEVLRDVRRRVDERIVRLTALAESLDRAIAAEEENGGIAMSAEEKLEVFGDFDPARYEAEATDRWGGTDAYAQASARTAGYGPEQWKAIGDEADSIYGRFADLMASDTPADAPEASAAVEEHREHISRWFYDCTPEIHSGLGQMYSSDGRFRETIDRHADGLAAYLSEAITAAYRR